jgi:hypothetical protein
VITTEPRAQQHDMECDVSASASPKGDTGHAATASQGDRDDRLLDAVLSFAARWFPDGCALNLPGVWFGARKKRHQADVKVCGDCLNFECVGATHTHAHARTHAPTHTQAEHRPAIHAFRPSHSITLVPKFDQPLALSFRNYTRAGTRGRLQRCPVGAD